MPHPDRDKTVVSLHLREMLLRIRSENAALYKLIDGLKKINTELKKPNQKPEKP